MEFSRLTLFISGNVQRAGYRDKIIELGKSLGLNGYAENLPDGRVKVVAEGNKKQLATLKDSADIKNTLINVEEIKSSFSNHTGEFSGFFKLVAKGETDERLDTAAGLLKELINVTKNGFSETIFAIKSVKEDTSAMLEKQDSMLEKQDSMLEKQDSMLDKQDTTIDILKGVKEDTSTMLDKQDSMLDKQDSMLDKQDTTIDILKGVKEDTSAIREDISATGKDMKDELYEKYEYLNHEITDIKSTLSEIKAKVM